MLCENKAHYFLKKVLRTTNRKRKWPLRFTVIDIKIMHSFSTTFLIYLMYLFPIEAKRNFAIEERIATYCRCLWYKQQTSTVTQTILKQGKLPRPSQLQSLHVEELFDQSPSKWGQFFQGHWSISWHSGNPFTRLRFGWVN